MLFKKITYIFSANGDRYDSICIRFEPTLNPQKCIWGHSKTMKPFLGKTSTLIFTMCLYVLVMLVTTFLEILNNPDWLSTYLHSL